MELPNCDVCGLSQTTLGALAFSAPIKIDGMDGLWCRKTHICTACTNAVASDKTKRTHDGNLIPKELNERYIEGRSRMTSEIRPKYTFQFFGGSGYGLPEGTGVEHADTLQEVKDILWRRHDFDRRFPCVGEDAECIIWKGHRKDVTDLYPDYRVYLGPRSGIKIEKV